jgi:DNA-binding GntR family transcriptional regulator
MMVNIDTKNDSATMDHQVVLVDIYTLLQSLCILYTIIYICAKYEQMYRDPIQHNDLPFQVYQRIKEMILAGEFAQGEKLPQEKIAARLGISRMPLHKAFAMLEDDFLVESIPRRGIFVRKPDLKEIIDAFECREGLEGIAARRAAVNLSDKEITALENLFKPFIDSKSFDKIKYQEADQAFHKAIIRASGNAIMQKLNEIGNVLISTYPKGIILPHKESMEDHTIIIEAFKSRDPIKSEEYVRAHSRKAKNILEQELKNKFNKL